MQNPRIMQMSPTINWLKTTQHHTALRGGVVVGVGTCKNPVIFKSYYRLRIQWSAMLCLQHLLKN